MVTLRCTLYREWVSMKFFFFHKCAENSLFYWNMGFFLQKMPVLTVFLLQIAQNQFSIFFKKVTFFKSLFFPKKGTPPKKKKISLHSTMTKYPIYITILKKISFSYRVLQRNSIRAQIFKCNYPLLCTRCLGWKWVTGGKMWQKLVLVREHRKISRNSS